MMRFIASLALLLTMTGATLAADCMTAQQEASVEGRLTRERFRDLVGRPEMAFILELKQPACLTGADEYDKVEATRTVHVYSMDRKINAALSGAVGKSVRVTGFPFGEENVHHHAPIVMSVTAVSAAAGKRAP